MEIFCRSVVSVNFFRPALAVGCIIHEIWECENSIPMCAIMLVCVSLCMIDERDISIVWFGNVKISDVCH